MAPKKPAKDKGLGKRTRAHDVEEEGVAEAGVSGTKRGRGDIEQMERLRREAAEEEEDEGLDVEEIDDGAPLDVEEYAVGGVAKFKWGAVRDVSPDQYYIDTQVANFTIIR